MTTFALERSCSPVRAMKDDEAEEIAEELAKGCLYGCLPGLIWSIAGIALFFLLMRIGAWILKIFYPPPAF